MTSSTRIKLSLVTILVVFTLLISAFLPVGVVQAKEGGSLPVSPAGMITDTTPTFKWYNITIATKYEYEVFKGTTKIYTKTAWPAGCGVTYCNQTPTTALPLDKYKWHIRYFNGSAWTVWSVWKYFTIVPPPVDFDAQFNGTSTWGWTVNPGEVWNVSSTALYSEGVVGERSSIYYSASPAYANFDFSARVRREALNNAGNYLMVRMGPNFNTDNDGYPGYIFGVRNDGYYSIWKYDNLGGVSDIQGWTYSTVVKPNDWNKLRVVAIGPYFNYYINGKLMRAFEDPSFKLGSVGFAMYDTGMFEVDWTHLDVLLATAVRSSDVVSPEQQALNEAAMQASGNGGPD